MFLVVAVLVLSASYVSSVPQPTTRSSRTFVYGATHTFTRPSTLLTYPTSARWAAGPRRIRELSLSTLILESSRAIPNNFADASDDVTTTMETTDVVGSLETGTSIEDLSSPTSAPTIIGTPSVAVAEFFSSATTSSTSVPAISTTSPVASPSPTSIPTLSAAASLNHLHPAIIPIIAGSGAGILALIGTITLLVCCRRHRTHSMGSGWFNSNEKKDTIVSIHVPPPTAPLKGILVQNPTSFALRSTEVKSRPDRVSLTSSQLSVIINNLPKTYDSGLESGVLDEVRAEGRGSPIRARRIGPSPSDFFVNLFAGSHINTPSSSDSAASQVLTSFYQSPDQEVVSVTPRLDVTPLQVNRAFVHPHTPTFPPSAAASPNLGFASGPRGHGLVLTGDLNAMVPSFAQWHYQRTVARGRDRNGAP